MKSFVKIQLFFDSYFWCFFVLCWLAFSFLHFKKISILYWFLQCFVDVGCCCCCYFFVNFLLFLAFVFGTKIQWKIYKKWVKNEINSGLQFWRPLGSSWASLGELLGLSWAPLGSQNRAQEGEDFWPKTVFLTTLTCIIYFFRFLLPLGASGVYLGRVLDPLGPLLGGFLTL